MTLSIIIVSYNVKYFLEQCLCSVKAAIQKIDAEVLVIDNGSADGSLAYLQPLFPWVQFISNPANDGFATANNKALSVASGEYILFLNPDTILPEDSLQRCLHFFSQTTKAGAIGVRMIDGAGSFLPESKRAFPSPLVSFYKLTGLSSLFPRSRLFGKYALGSLNEHNIHEVDVLAGAFMMVPKAVLQTTGGFDEQFFMYAEDIDLSYRIQQAGFRNYYLGDTSIVHFKGESTKKGNLNYVKVFYHAMSLFVQKHYSGTGALMLRQCLQLGIVVRGMIAAIGLPFRKKKTGQTAFYSHVFLLGAAVQTSAAAQIIKLRLPHVNIIHKNLDSALPAALPDNSLLVFCTGVFTYQQSLETLQRTHAAAYKWFGSNSRCIAGSHDKNTSGEVIVAE